MFPGNASLTSGAVCGCRHTLHEKCKLSAESLSPALACSVRCNVHKGNPIFTGAPKEWEGSTTRSDFCMTAPQVPVHCARYEKHDYRSKKAIPSANFPGDSISWFNCLARLPLHDFALPPCMQRPTNVKCQMHPQGSGPRLKTPDMALDRPTSGEVNALLPLETCCIPTKAQYQHLPVWPPIM